jgi:membrane protein YqaA with SNARE-associated domain
MIWRIIALIVIAGGILGALAGYVVVRWLDERRRREDWRSETEWLSPTDQDPAP